MTVNQYLFQSPSSSQVQVGRLDPSSKVEETKSSTGSQASSIEAKTAGEILSGNTANTVENINPTVNTNQLIDIYA